MLLFGQSLLHVIVLPHGHSAMPLSVAHIVVSPEMEVITEGVCDVKSLY